MCTSSPALRSHLALMVFVAAVLTQLISWSSPGGAHDSLLAVGTLLCLTSNQHCWCMNRQGEDRTVGGTRVEAPFHPHPKAPPISHDFPPPTQLTLGLQRSLPWQTTGLYTRVGPRLNSGREAKPTPTGEDIAWWLEQGLDYKGSNTVCSVLNSAT